MNLSRKFILSGAVGVCALTLLSGCANVQDQVNATVRAINEKAASIGQSKAATPQNVAVSNPAAAKPVASQAAGNSTIPALEWLKTCDVKSMPKAPIKLVNGLIITKIKSDPAFKGQTRVFLTFNKSPTARQETPIAMIKELTGYDFANPIGAVDFDFDTSGKGALNFVVCLKA